MAQSTLGRLVSWHQVEYYKQRPDARDQLYPEVPSWWSDAEVPAPMYVPQPPVVAYRGSEHLRGDPLHWTIFRTEWTTQVFGRWLADVRFRGLL